MTTILRRTWFRHYLLPIVILTASWPLTIIIGSQVFGMDDPDILWVLVLGPLMAILIGALARPPVSLVAPMSAVILILAFVLVSQGSGRASELALPIAGIVGVPLTILIWLGKQARIRYDDRRSKASHSTVA